MSVQSVLGNEARFHEEEMGIGKRKKGWRRVGTYLKSLEMNWSGPKTGIQKHFNAKCIFQTNHLSENSSRN